MLKNFDVIIIGSGPAGISAALYTVRSNLKTLVLSQNKGSLRKAEKIENYYGWDPALSGNELIATGINQAINLGVQIHYEEVLSIDYFDKLTVKTVQNSYQATSVLIATGAERNTPKIKGIKALEGKGVSYCAVCDAFFYRQKPVAVLGNGEYALHEALELLPVAKSVTILTNGQPLTVTPPEAIIINPTPVKELLGENTLQQIHLENETFLEIQGLFVAYGIAGSTALARKLGAETSGNNIVINAEMQTNIPGLFAAGDCTGGLLQIAKAVYQGAQAGLSMVKYCRANN